MSPCLHTPCLHISISPCLHVSMPPCLHASQTRISARQTENLRAYRTILYATKKRKPSHLIPKSLTLAKSTPFQVSKSPCIQVGNACDVMRCSFPAEFQTLIHLCAFLGSSAQSLPHLESSSFRTCRFSGSHHCCARSTTTYFWHFGVASSDHSQHSAILHVMAYHVFPQGRERGHHNRGDNEAA
jgi:hypothetical protein